jgi:hypothetical protein
VPEKPLIASQVLMLPLIEMDLDCDPNHPNRVTALDPADSRAASPLVLSITCSCILRSVLQHYQSSLEAARKQIRLSRREYVRLAAGEFDYAAPLTSSRTPETTRANARAH